MSDKASSIATVDLDELLNALAPVEAAVA